MLIMIGYYRFAGVLAVARAGCLHDLVAGRCWPGSRPTLTFPGIAGFVLSIGMAVDANVLIFERIREELARGRSVRAGGEGGLPARALRAIVDSNLTTLITARSCSTSAPGRSAASR